MWSIGCRGATDPHTSAHGRRHGRTLRVGGLAGAAVAVALIAGCGGSSSGRSVTHMNPTATAKSTTNSSTRPSLLAFATCMRTHGVLDYPDPKPPGQIPTTPIAQPAPGGGFTANPNSPAYQIASNDCKSLAVATKLGASQSSQVLTAELNFAVCMRTHGVPNYPDPANTGEIGNNGAIRGVDPSSPAVQGAEEKCSQVLSRPHGHPAGDRRPLRRVDDEHRNETSAAGCNATGGSALVRLPQCRRAPGLLWRHEEKEDHMT